METDRDHHTPRPWEKVISWWLRWWHPHQNARFAQHRVLRVLRETNVGQVLLAEEPHSHRTFVFKTLRKQAASPLLRERFAREIRILSQLSNPHSVRLFQSGEFAGQLYLSTEAICGGLTLEELVGEGGAIGDGRAIPLLIQLCSAIGELHAQGLIHRDIKPSNLMLSSRGGLPDWLTVLDFGLADQIQATVASGISGTPAYLSPEAATLETPLDARSDIYSLGCVAYFLLAGRPPFDSPNPIELCWRHAQHEPPALSTLTKQPTAPELSELVMQCLHKAPAARPQSTHEIAQRLERIQPLQSWSTTDAAQWWNERQID